MGFQGTTKKILIVDDCWDNRSVLVDLLEPLKFELYQAEHGQEGLAIALAERPDLIITDLVMPVMDGSVAVQTLHRMNPKLAVIMASGLASNQTEAEGLGEPVKAFLLKPFTSEELLQAIAKVLHPEKKS